MGDTDLDTKFRTIIIPRILSEEIDKLCDSNKGITFSEMVEEALQVYLMQLSLADIENSVIKEFEENNNIEV